MPLQLYLIRWKAEALVQAILKYSGGGQVRHSLSWSYTKDQGEELSSRKGKRLTSENKNPEHTIKPQENYQLIKMQARRLLKLLLFCGILLAVTAGKQFLAVNFALNKRCCCLDILERGSPT